MNTLLARMLRIDRATVDAAYSAFCAAQDKEREDAIAFVRERLGYVEIDEHDIAVTTADAEYMSDGRTVARAHGKIWAIPHDEMARAIEAAKRAALAAESAREETKSVVGTEELSVLVCPKCGDALQHTAVCPACAAGKLGYRHRYTCVCGAVDLISKEAL